MNTASTPTTNELYQKTIVRYKNTKKELIKRCNNYEPNLFILLFWLFNYSISFQKSFAKNNNNNNETSIEIKNE